MNRAFRRQLFFSPRRQLDGPPHEDWGAYLSSTAHTFAADARPGPAHDKSKTEGFNVSAYASPPKLPPKKPQSYPKTRYRVFNHKKEKNPVQSLISVSRQFSRNLHRLRLTVLLENCSVRCLLSVTWALLGQNILAAWCSQSFNQYSPRKKKSPIWIKK